MPSSSRSLDPRKLIGDIKMSGGQKKHSSHTESSSSTDAGGLASGLKMIANGMKTSDNANGSNKEVSSHQVSSSSSMNAGALAGGMKTSDNANGSNKEVSSHQVSSSSSMDAGALAGGMKMSDNASGSNWESSSHQMSSSSSMNAGALAGGMKMSDNANGSNWESSSHQMSSRSLMGASSSNTTFRSETKEVISATVSIEKSDAEWNTAQKLIAQAAEQSRIAQSRTIEAVKFKQTAEEARSAAQYAHDQVSKLKGKLSDFDVDCMEVQLTEVTEKYNVAKRNIVLAKAKLKTSQREAEDLKDKAEDLASQQQGPAKELEVVKIKLDRLHQKLEFANKDTQEYRACINTVRKQAESLQIQQSDIKSEMSNSEDQYEKAEIAIAEMEKKLQAARDVRDNAKRSYKYNKSELSSIESDLSSLHEDINNYEVSVKSSQWLADELAVKKESTQKVLVETQEVLKSLKGQTAKAQKEAEAKLKVIFLDQSALEKIMSEVAIQSEVVKVKQTTLGTAHQNLEPLQRQLDELRRTARNQEMRAERFSAKAKIVSDEADIAQAKKEELWYKAKQAGEGADEISDQGYLKATEAAGLDTQRALKLLQKSEMTAELAQKSSSKTITMESSKQVSSSSHSSTQ